MSLLIRKMTIEDLAQVIAIDRASFSLPWPERSFRFEITDNPAGRCWVVELDGTVVGSLVLWLIVDEVHVATIAIHPDFRRQGIGTALLLHALGAATPEGARSAHLEVRASNSSAQDLYRKLGFAETARAPRYYKDNGEDAVLMVLPALNAAMPVGNGASG